jgi:transketolase
MATTTTPGYDDLPALLTRLTGDEKHDRSSFSTLDVLWVLYDRVLGEEDRFLLSKGHGPTAFYAVLTAKGIIPVEALDGFGDFDSPLGYHPDRMLAPGVELSSGSLGHGLGVAVGAALTGRRVWCLVGDGELDEGSNWEAVQYAGRVGLGSLTAIVVDNDSAWHGWPGGIERRFMLEGWIAQRVDGRDHEALEAALQPAPDATRPRCVVAEVSSR